MQIICSCKRIFPVLPPFRQSRAVVNEHRFRNIRMKQKIWVADGFEEMGAARWKHGSTVKPRVRHALPEAWEKVSRSRSWETLGNPTG